MCGKKYCPFTWPGDPYDAHSRHVLFLRSPDHRHAAQKVRTPFVLRRPLFGSQKGASSCLKIMQTASLHVVVSCPLHTAQAETHAEHCQKLVITPQYFVDRIGRGVCGLVCWKSYNDISKLHSAAQVGVDEPHDSCNFSPRPLSVIIKKIQIIRVDRACIEDEEVVDVTCFTDGV